MVFDKGLVHHTAPQSCSKNGKNLLIKGEIFAALLADLSKAFGSLPNDLVITKLSLSLARLILSYLSDRKQRTKTNSTYSSWEEVLFGIP